MRYQAFLRIAVLGTVAWTIWLTVIGPEEAISSVYRHWKVATTMIFGSFAAGSTALGGGAVAFPVFTKILHAPPFEAKVFSLMIQSVGMGTATLLIILKRIKIEWNIILLSTASGVFGIILGSSYLYPLLPPTMIKLLFTMLLSSFGLTLLIMSTRKDKYNEKLLVWSTREKYFVLAAGFIGGVISGLQGSGIDVIIFSVMVLVFRISEKIATPTSVVIMAFNSIAGAILHYFIFDDVPSIVMEYWYAAIPMVVIGAPLGAHICSTLPRQAIVKLLVFLIATEAFSTFALIHLDLKYILVCVAFLILFLFSNILMLNLGTKLYKPA
jgi:uncharacterized membrane protein YfcA